MNRTALVMLRRACLALALLLSLKAAAAAQDVNPLRPPNLDVYEAAAVDSVEVTLDARILQTAANAVPEKDADDRAVKALLAGLKGVYVRAFRFDGEGAYRAADVEALRARFRSPEWSRVVGVRSRRYGGNVDVFVSASGSQLNGIGVVIAAARDLVYVHVSGPIDLEKLRDLEGRFRVPKLDLYREGKE
jgi:Domain of unknown function (DUF4252)